MTVFVSRASDGKINGVYAYICEGVAEEELPEDNPEVISFQNPQGPYTIPKMLLWTRLSDTEATAVDTAMSAQPARMRGIWNSASEVRSDSEFYGTLLAFLSAVLGDERAKEVASPE